MIDDAFLAAVERGAPPGGAFTHRDHVRLAWLVVRREASLDDATRRVRAAIEAVAAHEGHPNRYHETITRFGVRLVDHAVRTRPELDDFDGFADAFPVVLDSSAIFRHWRRETVLGATARAAWVEPDLTPLPA